MLLGFALGGAFVAIRDSEISAQSMGIHLARFKTMSFAISAALAAALSARRTKASACAAFTTPKVYVAPGTFTSLASSHA